MRRFLVGIFLVGLPTLTAGLHAAEWPQYRFDAARSGRTAEALADNLVLLWTHKPAHAPRPAWSGRDTRMPFDRAYHVVAAGGRLFFGSSADCKVYALDARTGTEVWTVFTGGPVRFAPVVWKDRVFAVSDDGFLYCLRARDGKQLWKRRGGPGDDMVLGNGQMVSRWPARGGAVVADDTVYFAAGIWPSEGVFIYALEAATGTVRWVNDSAGELVMEQPHGGNRGRSGLSAQGYLAADAKRLYVPTGRGVPAVLDRATGELLYFHLAQNIKSGGADVMASNGVFFNAEQAFDADNGMLLTRFGSAQSKLGVRVALLDDGVAGWTQGQARLQQWGKEERVDRAGKKFMATVLKRVKSAPAPFGGTSLMLTGDRIISGGKGDAGYGVCIVDLESTAPLWSRSVGADPCGLAVADGKLYVSTDAGTILCFGTGSKDTGTIIKPSKSRNPHPWNGRYADAAKEIIGKTGARNGYCVDLGCGTGALAYALAQATDLRIYAVAADPKVVAKAREKLDRAGLYGVRVTVHQADLSRTPYPDQFANLIVSGRAVTESEKIVQDEERGRLLRPYGGKSCLGPPGAMKVLVREELAGAGEWTHQYANPASTLCSDDQLVKGPLGMVWFTDFGLQMPTRHGRGPAPLYRDGIMVVEGVHALIGVDAYNGRKLWEFPLENILKVYDREHLLGTAGTNSNMCLGEKSVFVRMQDTCLRIDLATGKETQRYTMPADAEGNTGTWGFIAYADGTLYGSRANTEHVPATLFAAADMEGIYTESHALFALNAKTGQKQWEYTAKRSIRHNAIVIATKGAAERRVYLIDRDIETQDRLPKRRLPAKSPAQTTPAPQTEPRAGALLCLNAETGKTVWQQTDDIYGTTLVLGEQQGVLIMGYQYSQRRYQMASEKGDRLTGFRLSDGKRLWDTPCRYISRPILNGDRVYTQPHAYDIQTGQRIANFAVTGRQPGGCGPMVGSKNMFLFRSGTLAYFDLLRNRSTENYGGLRPGCWINALPVGGMVVMPDATDVCTCSYLMKASIALRPYGVRGPEFSPLGGKFSEPTQVTLVSECEDAAVRYTLDGSSPSATSHLYARPITITNTTVVKARAFVAGLPPSQMREGRYVIESDRAD